MHGYWKFEIAAPFSCAAPTDLRGVCSGSGSLVKTVSAALTKPDQIRLGNSMTTNLAPTDFPHIK